MYFTNTSHYDESVVREIVKHAAGNIDISNVVINVKNSVHHWAGRAYSVIPQESPWFLKRLRHKGKRPRPQYLIVCRIGGPHKFPYQTKGYPNRKIENGHWPTPLLADWQEALVFLVAHELMHIQQFRYKTRLTEKETEAYGMARLLAWRETKMATAETVARENNSMIC